MLCWWWTTRGLTRFTKDWRRLGPRREVFLYATNFHDGVVEMYNSHFQLVKTFTDTSVPPRYAPFNIRNINGKLYVTFAEQDEDKEDDISGPHHGFWMCSIPVATSCAD